MYLTDADRIKTETRKNKLDDENADLVRAWGVFVIFFFGNDPKRFLHVFILLSGNIIILYAYICTHLL